MDTLFEVSFDPLAATGRPLAKCGHCRRYMKYVQASPQRLHCGTCNQAYALPQNGTIKPYMVRPCRRCAPVAAAPLPPLRPCRRCTPAAATPQSPLHPCRCTPAAAAPLLGHAR